MKIHWNGHACFCIEASEGRVLMDPYAEKVPYDLRVARADVVTISHDHMDHNAVHRAEGTPSVIDGTGEFVIDGTPFLGIASFHDDQGGAERGANRIYAFTLEGIRLAHLGDLGAPLDEAQREALADVEVLFLPVGGHYTIDASQAAEIVRSLPGLRVVIPMHFKTDRTADWPIAPLEPFLEMVDNARRIGSPQVTLTREDLPEALEVWILDYA